MPNHVWGQPLSAAVSGVVRDVHGTPQMGALVELLSGSSATIASTLTDARGRYILPAINPGKYELRATAAFFVPASHPNVSLHAGAQAIIDVTMSTLFDMANWLPAERRSLSEPADDWKWTLRSTANRPILRLTDEDGIEISTSAAEVHRASMKGRMALLNGGGAFGDGGMHQVLTIDRTVETGDGEIFRADLGDPQVPLTVAPSVDVLAGYQRKLLNGRSRLVTSFASHPELIADGMPGLSVLRVASAQEISLGDMIQIDAGTLMEAEKLEASRMMNEPFVHLTVRPDQDSAMEFRYTAGREVQSASDLDRLKPQIDVLTDSQGRPLSMRNAHNQLKVSHKVGENDSVAIAVYRDVFANGELMGSGKINGETMAAMPVVSDPVTATFRLATTGYTARGAHVTYTHALTPSLKATAEYMIGSALRAEDFGGPVAGLRTQAHTASAASAGLHGKIVHTGTSVNAEYRWQPLGTLTQVDAYNAAPEEAYLSVSFRQRISLGRLLPNGMDAVVEATNLLEQGYQPVLAPDGKTLFLAQVPRAIQAGLAFNF